MTAYSEALTEAMTILGRDERTIFLGQAVSYPGTAMSGTLKTVPAGKKLEMPVAEEMQMGMSLGLALTGKIPVSIYPRWNFLLLATNQLVNHLDKVQLFSDYRPTILIRVGIGSEAPLDPGEQHIGDFSEAFRLMLKTIPVINMEDAAEIVPAYQEAVERGGATILVERSDLYNE